MSKPPNLESRQLRTLERWRTVELEHAQSEHAALLKVTLDKQAASERISEDIEQLRSMARDALQRAMSGTALSVESLRRLDAFAAVRAADLKIAQTELQQSQAESDAAHASLVQHFERLTVVERLQERRIDEGMKDLARQDQKRLDEHALTRLRPGSVDSKTKG